MRRNRPSRPRLQRPRLPVPGTVTAAPQVLTGLKESIRARRPPALRRAARCARRQHRPRRIVAHYYEEHQFAPVWPDPSAGPAGRRDLDAASPTASIPRDYHLEALRPHPRRAAHEKAMSARSGRPGPGRDRCAGARDVSPVRRQGRPGENQLAMELSSRPMPTRTGCECWSACSIGKHPGITGPARPQHVWYERGRERLREYRAIAAGGGWPTIAADPRSSLASAMRACRGLADAIAGHGGLARTPNVQATAEPAAA